MRPDHQAIVIGAGPAGLATSRELQRRGVDHVLLERASVGDSWLRVYDSLTLHTGKHMSALPGLSFSRTDPLFVPREKFIDYLSRYHDRFRLPVQSGTGVRAMRHNNGSWLVATDRGELRSAAVVVATGIMANPLIPRLAGQTEFSGTVRHSSTYRRPDECRGRRVLVVGAGNSGGEIASELGRAGVDTTISIRSGANVVPLHLLGVPIQYVSYLVRKLPRPVQERIVGAVARVTDWRKGPPPFPRAKHSPLDAIPLIGFRLIDAIRQGRVKVRGGIASLVPGGVLFQDGEEEPFDEIILATGFRPAVGFLSSLVSVDERGFAARRDRVTSSDQPDLYFVGHNYDATGALFNIRRDAPLAAAAVKNALPRT